MCEWAVQGLICFWSLRNLQQKSNVHQSSPYTKSSIVRSIGEPPPGGGINFGVVFGVVVCTWDVELTLIDTMLGGINKKATGVILSVNNGVLPLCLLASLEAGLLKQRLTLVRWSLRRRCRRFPCGVARSRS